jgi:hypothetical protein
VANGATAFIGTQIMTGAKLGDRLTVQADGDTQGLELYPWISAANNFNCVLRNNTSGSVTLACNLIFRLVRRTS